MTDFFPQHEKSIINKRLETAYNLPRKECRNAIFYVQLAAEVVRKRTTFVWHLSCTLSTFLGVHLEKSTLKLMCAYVIIFLWALPRS